jgi:flagellar motor switch protein FliG
MTTGSETGTLTGTQKAAILLAMIDDQASAGLLRKLGEEYAQTVTAAIAKLPPVSPEEAESVLEEFCRRTSSLAHAPRRGPDTSRRLLTEAFGPEAGQKIIERLPLDRPLVSAGVKSLRKTDPERLARFIHNEHPQTVALVLSHLDRDQAADLLVSLPPELRSDVALRMASLDQVSPSVIDQVADVIGQKLKTLGETGKEVRGGARAVAEILGRLQTEAANEILAGLENRDGGIAGSIRDLMFTFEELENVDVSGIRELISKVDRKVLTLSLKGTGESLRQHIVQAMSQRSAEMLREDMEALGPVKIKEVEAAQQQIITIARQLEKEGRLSLSGSSEGQYVD